MAANKIVSLLFSVMIFAQAHAQKKVPAKPSAKWDVNNPPGNFKDVKFTVSEGTWMNVDVSPDGHRIVFDLLGDIYTMPVTGGLATPLRRGNAFEVQPRYSPDGKKILFTSDAGGGDNIWQMNVDGSVASPITNETFRLLNNGAWDPGGNYIVARKHFTSTRSAGAGEIWLYHISGGNGLQLTTRRNDQKDVNEPCISPDGRYLYFSEDMTEGNVFEYNKDPNNEIFEIRRLDRVKGTIQTVTGGPGSAMRPQLSRDGKQLAFIKRVRTKTVLYIRDLESGNEWPVYELLSKDQQEAWTIFGSYTGYSWMPGDKEIVIWANGKIMRVDLSSNNKGAEIPFSCEVNSRLYEAVRFQQKVFEPTFTAKVIRQAITSPDEKQLIFSAAGNLWRKQLPGGNPARVSNGAAFEFDPSFSPDGRSLIYTSWSDTAAGAIWRATAGQSEPVKLTIDKAIYRTPSISPDGRLMVFIKENASNELGPAFTGQPGIYVSNVDGSNPKFVRTSGTAPVFNRTSDRIYYQLGGGLSRTFASCKIDGSEEEVHLKSTYGSQFIVSPDEQWIAFIDLHNVYVSAFPKTGKTIDIGGTSKDFPVKIVSRDAGINLHWSADSKRLHYTLGEEYFTIDLSDRFGFISGKPDSAFTAPQHGVSVGLQLSSDKPTGLIALTNARIITMKGAEVIEQGTVLVDGNVIKAVGTSAAVSIPVGTTTINCSGKTIVPGFIDAHAHANHFYSGITPQKHWPYYAALAYGVTTIHDPSANSEFVFGLSELVKAGKSVGPRVFSTGTVLYGADGNFKAVINSLDDARSALRRTRAYGAFSVKSYNQPRREQNQMILEAARELKIEVVPEGGSLFYHNIAMVLDGHTTIEHNLPVAPLYDDVIKLWKHSATAYTPTLIVNYGGLFGEFYWYQHRNLWENKRMLRFTPRTVIDSRSRRRVMAPEEEYENGHILVARSVKKLADAGVVVNMGAHGQVQGIGAHWEIWMMQQGGMSNLQALQTATINPAISLGLDKSIGSLEVGKLADLIVMDENPLDDIHNTETISATMVNGRIYDAEFMNEIGNHPKPAPIFYWQLNKNAVDIPLQDTHAQD